MEALSRWSAARTGLRVGPQVLTAFRHAVLILGGGTLAALALFLLVRGARGALVRPLPIAQLLPACLLLGIAGVAFRQVACREKHTARAASHRQVTFAHGMAMLAAVSAVMLAASLGGSRGWRGLGVTGVCLAAVELAARGRKFFRAAPRPLAARAPSAAQTLGSSQTGTGQSSTWQQWSRMQSATEGDVIEGWQRVRFLPGQRTASVHLSFCPPFESTPRLTCHTVAGPEARVEIVQLWPYAARIDLRLPRTAVEATEIQLALQAECTAAPSTAPSSVPPC